MSRDLTFSEATRVISWYVREEQIVLNEKIIIDLLRSLASSKPTTNLKSSPKETMNSGFGSESRSNSTGVGTVEFASQKSCVNNEIKEEKISQAASTKSGQTDGFNMSNSSSSPVVNLQAKALQLKQKGSVTNKPAIPINYGKYVVKGASPEPQIVSRVLARSPPRREYMITRPSSYSVAVTGANSLDKLRREGSPKRHLLTHKNNDEKISRTKELSPKVHDNSNSLHKPWIAGDKQILSGESQFQRQLFVSRAAQQTLGSSVRKQWRACSIDRQIPPKLNP